MLIVHQSPSDAACALYSLVQSQTHILFLIEYELRQDMGYEDYRANMNQSPVAASHYSRNFPLLP